MKPYNNNPIGLYQSALSILRSSHNHAQKTKSHRFRSIYIFYHLITKKKTDIGKRESSNVGLPDSSSKKQAYM